MILDTSRAPVIFAYTHGHSPLSFEDQLTALLDRGAAFVLVTDHGPDDHFDETPTEKKQRTLFLKGIRAKLVASCRGMIVLEKGRPPSAAAAVAAVAAGKVFGIPIVFAADEGAAMIMGPN